VLDVEPPPLGLPSERHLGYGYSMYSARYGNIYTLQQLLQLAREAFGEFSPHDSWWHKGDRVMDAQRPNVEPQGFRTVAEAHDHRVHHLTKVRQLFLQMDVLVFTLGLTEAWVHAPTGTLYPLAPGTVAGRFDPAVHQFRNFGYGDAVSAFEQFEDLLRRHRPLRSVPRFILTVSPVPLVASASGTHVLPATTYSKSTLRAVAGDLCQSRDYVDYFPSYEAITHPGARGVFYDANLRTVRSAGVDTVMAIFFSQHQPQHSSANAGATQASPSGEGVQCEEALLEAFGNA